MSRSVALLPLVLVLGGCGAGESHEEPTVRDSAGVRIVENPAPDDRVAFELEPEPALAIGTVDGPVEYAFQGVRDAALMPDGRVVVADGAELRFYDPAGRHQRTSGGEGEGPGEFTMLNAVVPCGDVLLAGDMRQQRITVFDTGGEFVRTDALPASGNMFFALILEACDAETGLPLLRAPPALDPATQASSDPSVPVLRVDVTAGQIDTIARVPSRRRSTGVSSPLEPNTLYAFSPSAVHTVDTESIEVRSFGTDGALRQVARVPHTPRAVSAEDNRRAIDARVSQMPEGFAEQIRTQMEDAPKPPHMPAVGALAADAAGRVWIRPFTPPGQDAASTWLVLNPDGTYAGSVELPPRFRPLDIGEDRVLGVAEDELGVPYVQLYRIVQSGN